MKTTLRIAAAACVCVMPVSVAAYEVETHAAMTAEAIRQSLLTANANSSATFKRLGLFDLPFAIGGTYIDLAM